jgi:selenocysteine lyase/cysteine desulfurase
LGFPNLERVAFTPNVTVAINLALNGFRFRAGDRIISSALEHNSVARPLKLLTETAGVIWDLVYPREDGLVHAADFGKAIRPETRLAAVCHASNVTGAIAPAREIKEALGDIPLLLDVAQSAGSLSLGDLGSYADLVAFTGHKGLLGPTGTGGLWIREGLPTRPLAVGGSGSRSESLEHPDFLPDALEAGTLNVHGLAGLAAGVDFILEKGAAAVRAGEMELLATFLDALGAVPTATVLGRAIPIAKRVATVSLNLRGWSSSDLAARLEKDYGIMTRAGLHCAPLAHRAMGTFPGGAVRFSFGAFNSPGEALEAARALAALGKEKN